MRVCVVCVCMRCVCGACVYATCVWCVCVCDVCVQQASEYVCAHAKYNKVHTANFFHFFFVQAEQFCNPVEFNIPICAAWTVLVMCANIFLQKGFGVKSVCVEFRDVPFDFGYKLASIAAQYCFDIVDATVPWIRKSYSRHPCWAATFPNIRQTILECWFFLAFTVDYEAFDLVHKPLRVRIPSPSCIKNQT